MKKFYFIISLLFLLFITIKIKAQTEITFYTTKGNFIVKMYDTITPITSGNFISLVNAKFYDGIIFHRVINNFMIQGGDPLGTGYGGPGYTIPDEFDSTVSNIQKTISMANSGPNTGGSQFFINLVNNTFLDYNKPPYTSAHPVFGIVISNFSVVQTIGSVPVNASNLPLTPVVMDSLRVTYNPFTGINDMIISNTKIEVFPVPTEDKLYFNMGLNDNSIVEIYSLSGFKVLETTLNPMFDFLDVSDLISGCYIGKLNSKKNKQFFRFVKN
jgi:cyclophilin family peptidyl-prolyl cis-trans isomerase